MNIQTDYLSSTINRRCLQGIAKICCVFALLALSGCQTTPVEQHYAKQFQANLQFIQGEPYLHASYVNAAAFALQTSHQPGKFLHVYIEGDGKAFVNGKVSANPTPDNPLMLKLMHMDTRPAVYLGRPCYFNAEDTNCSPNVWTRQRYSEKVINSMAHALQHFSNDYDHLVLIGHSGGGTIATLLAEKMSKTSMVVTLAGNLDTFAWAVNHQYQPLKLSLNPSDRPNLSGKIIQIHYAGANDTVINPDWIEAYANKQQRAEFHRLPKVDHINGWEAFWPQVLKKLLDYQQFVTSE
ncbi:MAG: alpha/beta hydrolase [Gammaproteobacteria bacterium]|nr:MAG: alpha/beta hydrolase [Gammaproteobacteria bacterium]